MDGFSDRIQVKVTPGLRADFRFKAKRFGFSMSGAVKSMIRDFLTGKRILTEYPDLKLKGRPRARRPYKPRGKPFKHQPITPPTGLTERD